MSKQVTFDPTEAFESSLHGDDDWLQDRLNATYNRIVKVENKESFVQDISKEPMIPENVRKHFQAMLFCDQLQEKYKGFLKKKRTRRILNDDDDDE